jgi:hypothetical protein
MTGDGTWYDDIGLADFFYFARSDAARTYMHANMGTMRSYRLDRLQIRLGYFFRLVIRMAHLIAAELAFSTDLTCTCHDKILPSDKWSNADRTIP